MRLILAGCEYSGTTTIAHAIDDWAEDVMGARFPLIHDHYKIPHTSGHPPDLTPEEQKQVLALSPKLKEMFQRHSLYYHIHPHIFKHSNYLVIGLHIEDAIYGPLYFDYGGEGEPQDRRVVSQDAERMLSEFAPDVVLILVKASPEVIARRMKENPHDNGVLRENDIDYVLRRFQEETERSKIRYKFTLDTSTSKVEDVMAQFAAQIEPYLTQTDRLRILTHRFWGKH